MVYQIPNWSSYQSYKDRKPTWLRLHVRLIDNYEFSCLSDGARALLPLLWIIASEDVDPRSGIIDASIEKLAFRLRRDAESLQRCIDELEKHLFIKKLHSRTESVTPETETETETETENNNGFLLTKQKEEGRHGKQKISGAEAGRRAAKNFLDAVD